MMLEQERAAKAYEHVAGLGLGKSDKRRYGIMALKLTTLIRAAGLCQALQFIKSRGEQPYELLLNHLAQQLQRRNPKITDAATLCNEVRQANVQQYLQLTREALAVANWYGRLAQSELNVKPDDEVED